MRTDVNGDIAAIGAPSRPASAERVPESREYRRYLQHQRRWRSAILMTQLGLLAGFLLLWEVAPRLHWVNPMLTSSPSALTVTLADMFGGEGLMGSIWMHTGVTIAETLIGFLLSMLIGTAVAVIFWLSDFTYKVLDPYMVVINALPKIALVPIFYVWLGPTLSIYAMAITIAVFVTILTVYSGFSETDPQKIKMARTFGATRWQILTKIVLPANMAPIVAALKINVGLTLVGVIVGEFQSAKAGLGYLIMYGSQIFQMNVVMASIAILVVISIAMYGAIAFLESRIRAI